MHFESAYSDDVNGTGLVTPPGGKNGSDNHVMNHHTYCCQIHDPSDVCASGEPNYDKYSKICRKWHADRVGTADQTAKDFGIPLIVSEFGACFDTENCANEITAVADAVDSVVGVGWAYWQFKIYEDLTTTAGTAAEGFYNLDGSLQHSKVKALARSYVQKAQGTIKSMDFSQNGNLTAVITVDARIHAPTEIFLNKEYWYRHGFHMQVRRADSGERVHFWKRYLAGGTWAIMLHDHHYHHGHDIVIQVEPRRKIDEMKEEIEEMFMQD